MPDNDWQQDSDSEFEAPSGGIDIWGIVNRRKWIIIAVTILALGGGFLYFLRAKPVYQSSARVLIERKRPPSLAVNSLDSSGYDGRSETAKHPIVMTSPFVVSKAVEQAQLGELPSLAGNPVGTIIKNLRVEAVGDGVSVYNISVEGSDPQDTATIANALLTTYGDLLEESHRDVDRETREYIVEAKDELHRQLTAREQAYNEFRQEAPLLWHNGSGTNIHQDRQAEIEAKRSNILLQMAEVEAQLATIQNTIQQGTDVDTLLFFLANGRESNTTVSAAEDPEKQKQILIPLLLDEGDAVSRYAEDHPNVKSLRRRIEMTKRLYGGTDWNFELEPSEDAADDGTNFRQALLDKHVAALGHQLKNLNTEFEQLDSLFLKQEEDAKSLAVHQIKDEAFRSEKERIQTMFEAVVKQLEGISLVKDYEGYNFQILSPAAPGWQIEPNVTKVFAISLVLGGLAGFGLGYLVDLADKSFRSPVEISQHLRLPVVGHIPIMDPERQKVIPGSQCAPVLTAIHHPKSPYSEAYRTVRTALFFNARGNKHQVIQVTSPTPGDGKSTLSANLAITIANAGKSVLLLDADFRKPTQHKLFGLHADVGLASVVDGQSEPQEAYQKVPEVPNLTIMACGPRPENPSELLSSVGFQETLSYLREQFDFVIVDTPPLLAVSDPSAVAGQVDGVIVTLRITKQTRPVALRARDTLLEIGAEIVGIVVNGVGGLDGYGYKYGYGYDYKYGYGARQYGYGYGYGYGEEEDSASDTSPSNGSNGKASRRGNTGESGDGRRETGAPSTTASSED